MALEPDEAGAVVSGGEAGVGFLLVLEDALEEIAGGAYIDGAAFACHYVGGVGGVAHGDCG